MATTSFLRFGAIRFAGGVLVLLFVVALIFVLGHVVGNPAQAMSPSEATPEQIARLAAQLGLDKPLHEQAANYFGGLLRLDFGQSYWQNRPAMTVVMEALPNTILLTLASIVIASLWGGAGGLFAGAWPGSWWDRLGNLISVVALSMPTFWFGLLLIAIIAVQLRLLPTSGFNNWQSLILPAFTLGIEHGGRVFQLVRSATFEEMTKPYALVARSKGLPERLVLWKHVFRNTSVTVVTTIGWEYARMFGGTAFGVEVVFAWPGIGQLTVTAAQRQDFPVLQAAVIVAGAFVILANTLVDISYRFLDTRVKVH